MINLAGLINNLEGLKNEIPGPGENARFFIAKFANSAPNLEYETTLIKIFFAYNGLGKVCIDSNEKHNIISNAHKIAEEIHDIYNINKEDIALICYSFLTVNDYKITKEEFISASGTEKTKERSKGATKHTEVRTAMKTGDQTAGPKRKQAATKPKEQTSAVSEKTNRIENRRANCRARKDASCNKA